jgi:regulator of CtrA degradation
MQVAHGPVIFLGKTYDEALALTLEARDYLAHAAGDDRQELDLLTDMNFSMEVTRLTTILTQVMAWLLVQKAITMGEIDALEAARPAYRLGGQSICLFEGTGARGLPERIRGLGARARRLYVRVQRLDQMAAEQGGLARPVRA